jgi:hypothetical protein
VAQLVTTEEQRHSLREQQRRQQVALLLLAQNIDGRVVRRALGAAVPAIVVVGTVLVVLTVGLVMLVIVADKVLQRESVMTGDEVDAGIRLAPVILIQVAAAGQARGRL